MRKGMRVSVPARKRENHETEEEILKKLILICIVVAEKRQAADG